MSGFPIKRMRRLRVGGMLRDMLAEVRLWRQEFVAPLFVCEGSGVENPIPSMPGQFQFSVDTAVETVRRWVNKGLPAVLLFGVPGAKDAAGSGAWDEQGLVQRLTRQIRRAMGDIVVITDTCLCEYTDHGHCGPITKNPSGSVRIDNDAALDSLARAAVSQARAGADIVAPSAMMDGQVAAIRTALDAAGFTDVGIMSYAVKFASSLYGPFRQAAQCSPQFGDRRSYQMDYRSGRQSCVEARLDIEEGADMLMVKPAATYLDVIANIRRQSDLPLAAFHVSGEYACLKAAAQAGWLDERAAAIEVTTAIKRAGADLIITYFAEQLADWL